MDTLKFEGFITKIQSVQRAETKSATTIPGFPLQAQFHLPNQQHRPLIPHFNVLINILMLLKLKKKKLE